MSKRKVMPKWSVALDFDGTSSKIIARESMKTLGIKAHTEKKFWYIELINALTMVRFDTPVSRIIRKRGEHNSSIENVPFVCSGTDNLMIYISFCISADINQ